MESSGNHGANLRVGSQQTAEANAQDLSVLVVAHRELYLHIFGGVQSVGIFEMSVSDGAGASQQGDHFLLGWDQVHSFPYCCAISGPNAGAVPAQQRTRAHATV